MAGLGIDAYAAAGTDRPFDGAAAHMPDRDFWGGRRVFVTGHTGFIGGWLSLWLGEMGAEVTGLALDPPTDPSFYKAVRLGETMHSRRGDIRDRATVAAALAAARPDIVLHLAAQPLVREASQDPLGTLDTNVMGTATVLEALRDRDAPAAIVVFTTDKVYRNVEWPWGYRETDPLGGLEAYGASKACAEIVTEAYAHAFLAKADGGPGIATVRAGNVIGGGDWAKDRIVPDAMRAFLAGRPLEVRNPHAIRPWQHVLEPVRGLLLLAERLSGTPGWDGGWNLGPSDQDTVPVGPLADRLAALWGDGASWTCPSLSGQPYEAKTLRLDSSKAAFTLGHRPALPLPAALEMTVAWYKAAAGGTDMRELSKTQIARYTALGTPQKTLGSEETPHGLRRSNG